MSVQKKWERVLNNRFSMGHASWPVFGNPMNIGDTGRVDGGLFRRLQSATSMNADLSHAELREGPGSSLELMHGVEASGSLAASAGSNGGAQTVNLSFSSASSFWFYAPVFTVQETDAPENLGRQVAQLLETQGRGLAASERIVYRLVRVSAGTFLWSDSNSATATVAIEQSDSSERVEIRSHSSSLVKMELAADAESAVIAFDLLRVGANRVHVGV